MSAPIVKLFTQPNFAWTDIRKEEEAHPRHYLPHLLLLALPPAVCLFIGLPTFMHERKEQGLLNAACVGGLGLLVLVSILVEIILVWFNVLTP